MKTQKIVKYKYTYTYKEIEKLISKLFLEFSNSGFSIDEDKIDFSTVDENNITLTILINNDENEGYNERLVGAFCMKLEKKLKALWVGSDINVEFKEGWDDEFEINIVDFNKTIFVK